MPDNSAAGAPWRRCVVILRSMGAQTCVIEPHYVCLDHRSEISAFYSQLDEPIERLSARLHFFSKAMSDVDLMNVGDDEYLGYIVTRSMGMPPIVRAMLRPPFTADETGAHHVIALSEESVNFYGQKLRIAAVPFMQQDTRYATCAHAAAWMILYSSFRHGITERRLISELVDASGAGQLMRPVVSDGLRIQEVLTLLQLSGLSAAHHRLHPPTHLGLCEIQGSHLAQADLFTRANNLYQQIQQHAAAVEAPMIADFDLHESLDPMVRARQFSREFGVLAEIMLESTIIDEDNDLLEDHDAIRKILPKLIDGLTADFVQPFLESGFPLYCHTENHALVLCGLLRTGTEVDYVFHDDVFGPYLLTSSIVQAHREDFDAQSATEVGSDTSTVPGPELLRVKASKRSGTSRHVHSLVIPTPRRALLPPMAAARSAIRFLGATNSPLLEALRQEGIDVAIDDHQAIPTVRPRAVLMMGIDFKRARRLELTNVPDAERAYSSVHLAEWVVVIEYCNQGGQVSTELVYDASSGDYEPRLQLMRVNGELRARRPGATYGSWTVASDGSGLPTAVDVPLHVGKVS